MELYLDCFILICSNYHYFHITTWKMIIVRNVLLLSLLLLTSAFSSSTFSYITTSCSTLFGSTTCTTYDYDMPSYNFYTPTRYYYRCPANSHDIWWNKCECNIGYISNVAWNRCDRDYQYWCTVKYPGTIYREALDMCICPEWNLLWWNANTKSCKTEQQYCVNKVWVYGKYSFINNRGEIICGCQDWYKINEGNQCEKDMTATIIGSIAWAIALLLVLVRFGVWYIRFPSIWKKINKQ